MYAVLKANRVQDLINNFTKHDAHNCQNVEIDDYINLVLIIIVIDVRMMFFIVVVIVFSYALIVSIIFFLVELIATSFEIELFATFVCRVKLLVADDTHFDDDNDDVFNF